MMSANRANDVLASASDVEAQGILGVSTYCPMDIIYFYIYDLVPRNIVVRFANLV
jgi:hypothetical protein